MGTQGYRSQKWVKGGSFVAGLAVLVLLLVSWRIPPGTGMLGAELAFVAIPTGELEISPAGSFLRQTDLRPSSRSDGADGVVKVQNQTGRTLRVRLRAPSAQHDLDRIVRVELSVLGRPFFDGRLGGLRTWERRGFLLASGEARDLRLRAWLPRPVANAAYEGRFDTMTVEFLATPVRSR